MSQFLYGRRRYLFDTEKGMTDLGLSQTGEAMSHHDRPYTWRNAVDGIKLILEGLEQTDVPVVEMPDAAGAVRDLERRLAELRHRWNEAQVEEARDPESELGPPTMEHSQFGSQTVQVVGREYRTVTNRSAKRTYNTAALLRGIAVGLTAHSLTETSELDALQFVLRGGIASVAWKWTPLTRLARDLGLPLRTVDHAIPDDGDLDAPHVGEEWRESIHQEAVKEGA
jgi:hypothetical protein